MSENMASGWREEVIDLRAYDEEDEEVAAKVVAIKTQTWSQVILCRRRRRRADHSRLTRSSRTASPNGRRTRIASFTFE